MHNLRSKVETGVLGAEALAAIPSAIDALLRCLASSSSVLHPDALDLLSHMAQVRIYCGGRRAPLRHSPPHHFFTCVRSRCRSRSIDRPTYLCVCGSVCALS